MSTSTRTSLLHPALAYARAGRRVAPVCRDKRPYFKSWLDSATTDAAQIESWWKQVASANIVTPTGAAAGFFVLDVDPRNGGDTSLADLAREHDALPPTLTCATGGGGFHYYFKTPSFSVRSMVIAPGLDILGEKRAVTLPPSVHANGTTYRWHGPNREISNAPAWLLDRVRPIERAAHTTTPTVIPSGDTYAQRALEYEADGVRRAAEGARNITLNKASFNIGQLVGAGLLDEEIVISVLTDAAASAGLGEREARATIASGLRAGIAKPRASRPRRAS